MIWDAISYHGRSYLLQIEVNLKTNRYVCEVLLPKVVLFLHGNSGAIFHQDNARPHVTKSVRDFWSAQRIHLLPWPTHSLNLSPPERG